MSFAVSRVILCYHQNYHVPQGKWDECIATQKERSLASLTLLLKVQSRELKQHGTKSADTCSICMQSDALQKKQYMRAFAHDTQNCID